jgi:YidC/Oxa1 family membrane protein insertase
VNPLNPLYDAVAWVIMQIHAGLGALFGPASGWAWALSIVVLVVAMRLLLLPLFIKQMHATRKMTALAPQVAELKKKYKNDKQKLNEATMALYKENGANPLAGCLPIAAQLPVFFALFGVLRAISQDHAKYGLTSAVVASAQHAHIFGVTVADKFLASIKPPTLYHISGTSRLVIILTVVVSATTTFMTVRQSTKRGMMPQMTGPADSTNPMASSQKFMAYIVPVFALSGLYWQYGLVLYWVTTNLWTLGQQHVLFKRFPPLTPAAGAAAGGGGTAVVKQQIVKSAPRRPAGAGKPAAAAGNRPATAGNRPATAGNRPATAGNKPAGTPAKPAANRRPVNQLRGGNKPPGPVAKQPAGSAAADPGPTATPVKGTVPKAAGAKAAGSKAAAPKAGSKAPASANGSNGGGAGGALRRLVKGRGEPEPAPEPGPAETKLVRQQPVRQPRSRRSGKR